MLVWAVTAETHRPQYIVGLDARFINMPFLALPRRCSWMVGLVGWVGCMHLTRRGSLPSTQICTHRLMNKLEDGSAFAQMLPAVARQRV